MNFLNDIYKQRLAENEKNIKFWEEYLCSLKELDFSVYSEKLTVPILAPIGSRILFRGNIKHTNEVTVALGADYFAKCSLKQAEVIRQHRINGAKSKLDTYYGEKKFLENQLFGRENMYENHENDIVEHYTEEEDLAWREKHKEKLRQYHQNKSKQDTTKSNNDDEKLWQMLDELELQEELENELVNEVENCANVVTHEIVENNDKNSQHNDTCDVKKEECSTITNTELPQFKQPENTDSQIHNIPNNTSKLNVLEQVIEKQKTIKDLIHELRNRKMPLTDRENFILYKLEEIEQLEELEDEVNRLDDLLTDDDMSLSSDESDSENQTKGRETVSFANDESNTLEITFKHSEIEPCNKPYDSIKGITKPSDIYEAYYNVFCNTKTKSILKKSKYTIEDNNIEIHSQEKGNISELIEFPDRKNTQVNNTIILNDIVEKVEEKKTVVAEKRPTSLFKQRRSKNA